MAPEVFELDNEGISIPIVDQIKAEIIKFAEDAKDSCPVEAITIIKY
ncbi:ferredoxin [Turicibacter sp. T129]|nr:ferredoxin [Turicibacter sp. T129]MCU7206473.1 ferredoxin [Turicibacter sp. GALT-G1]